jgi:hypothetical protein
VASESLAKWENGLTPISAAGGSVLMFDTAELRGTREKDHGLPIF